MSGAFRSARERRLWGWAAGLLVLIYLSLYPVRPVAEWLRGRGWLEPTIAGLFLVAAAGVARWSLVRSPGRRELTVLALGAVAYLAVLWPIRMPEERFHLLEYGLFGGLVYAALVERQRPGGELRFALWPAALALALTGLAGWLDEGIQHLLPNRHYDWVDIGLNLLAGVLAVALVAGLAEARRSDPRRC
jgi:hypothetical protein